VTPDEAAELEAWELEQLEDVEVQAAQESQSPALLRFRRHAWVSRSNGRGRGPRRPREVDLLHDTWDSRRPPVWRSVDLVQFDVLATETYGEGDGLELESRLMREVMQCRR